MLCSMAIRRPYLCRSDMCLLSAYDLLQLILLDRISGVLLPQLLDLRPLPCDLHLLDGHHQE